MKEAEASEERKKQKGDLGEMIRGILFDMDGLMFDTEAIGLKGWKKAGEELGIRITDEMVASLRGLGNRERRARFGEMTGRPELFDAAQKIRIEYSDSWIREKGVPVKPGLTELLEYLKDKEIPAALAIDRTGESRMVSAAGRCRAVFSGVCLRCGGGTVEAGPGCVSESCSKIGTAGRGMYGSRRQRERIKSGKSGRMYGSGRAGSLAGSAGGRWAVGQESGDAERCDPDCAGA